MADLPRLKKHKDRTNINIMIDKEIDELYRLAKQNGFDSSEIARKAVTDKFIEIKAQIKRPAS